MDYNLHMRYILKVNKIIDEEKLVLSLKKAFKMSEVGSMEELEQKINKEEKSIVCIFENLHNLSRVQDSPFVITLFSIISNSAIE